MSTEDKGWGIFYDSDLTNVIHVSPIDEEHEHEALHLADTSQPPISLCYCMPKVEWNEEKGTWLIIHGAFDGREAIEDVNEILK